MHAVDLKSWAEFKDRVSQITKDIHEKRAQKGFGHVSCPLFRGHACDGWKLETTLERAGFRNMSVDTYYGNVRSAHRFLSNFAEARFQLVEPKQATWDSLFGDMPNYEFLAYLRHHGFLSPLLDWSQSPYVAAYFAFADPKSSSEKAAIFAYQEYYGRSKAFSRNEGAICTRGPWAAVHERHVLQQSWYTYSIRDDASVHFYPHEDTLANRQNDTAGAQDIVVKFTIPRTERIEVLRDLLQMNITPYSLFRSTDALVATVGMKLFDGLGD